MAEIVSAPSRKPRINPVAVHCWESALSLVWSPERDSSTVGG